VATVIGGLFTAALLTMFVLPVVHETSGAFPKASAQIALDIT